MMAQLVQIGSIAAWCFCLAGCTVCELAKRTMIYEPAAFSWEDDRPRSLEVYGQLADTVWAEESGNCPEMATERDYYLGFRDGFVDYVWAGGNAEPPPVPPRHFWNVMLRSPEGKRRADLWSNGYRHGARVARFGGFREMGRINSTLAGIPRDADSKGINGDYHLDPTGPSMPEPAGPAPVLETLPEPYAIQPPATTITPTSVPPRHVKVAHESTSIKVPSSSVPAERPIGKQPAALEALGLALLPTDPASARTPRSRPVPSGAQPSTPSAKSNSDNRAQFQTPSDQLVVPAGQPVLAKPAPVEPRRPLKPSAGSQSRAPAAALPPGRQPVGEIALMRPLRSQRIAPASHTKVVTDTPKSSTQVAYSAPMPEPIGVTQSAKDQRPEKAQKTRLQSTVIAAVHEEPVATLKEEPVRSPKIVDVTPTQPDTTLVIIEETKADGSIRGEIQESRTLGESSLRVRLSEDEDQSVDRIVIAPSPQATHASPMAAQSNPARSVVKIRTSVSETERIPLAAPTRTISNSNIR
jgi:hypothetical protein